MSDIHGLDSRSHRLVI